MWWSEDTCGDISLLPLCGLGSELKSSGLAYEIDTAGKICSHTFSGTLPKDISLLLEKTPEFPMQPLRKSFPYWAAVPVLGTSKPNHLMLSICPRNSLVSL